MWGVTPDVFLHANEDLDGVSHPAIEKAADLSPTTIGWLADVDRPAGRGQGRPSGRRREGRASPPARRRVWVSNHGGRQLDQRVDCRRRCGRSPRRSATGPRCTSTAASATVGTCSRRCARAPGCVFVGRPALWALATRGAQGVADLLTC